MDKLENLRKDWGAPIKITSAYRCSKHNESVSDTGKTGAHTLGMAVDIPVSGKAAYDLLHLAMLHGFTGIGIKQSGDFAGRFLHLDTMIDTMVRPRVWSYA
jgi:zinc D-Ala-D-Ala carboxypeptidase